MKWHEVWFMKLWRYVDSDGKICGEVFKMGDSDYQATMGKRDLGRFIDSDSAQAAVVDCYKNPRRITLAR